jgi:uncharacterized protein (DUF305 family)
MRNRYGYEHRELCAFRRLTAIAATGPSDAAALPMQLLSSTIRARLFVMTVAVVAAAACDDSDDSSGMAPSPIPASDVAYIDMLTKHHQGALEMANHEIERGASAELKAMAEQMKQDQQAEIDLMQQVRREIAADEDNDAVDDRHMQADMEHMVTLSGAALDEMFLRDMIPHHAGAVVMSHNALPNLGDQRLKDIAETTIVKQTRESNELLDMLESDVAR